MIIIEKLLTYLVIFLSGFAFCQWLVPLGDSLTQLLDLVFNVFKSKLSVSIAKSNATIQKLQGEEEEVHSNVIGFTSDFEGYDDEEEEDEDD